MKASLLYTFIILTSASFSLAGEQSLDSIQKMEASGDTMGARTALARAAQASPNSVAAWTAYGEFLDRYGDPAAREAYGKLIAALRNGGDSARAATVARRLALLDLLAGDRIAANTHLDAYRAAGGKPVSLGPPPPADTSAHPAPPPPGPPPAAGPPPPPPGPPPPRKTPAHPRPPQSPRNFPPGGGRRG